MERMVTSQFQWLLQLQAGLSFQLKEVSVSHVVPWTLTEEYTDQRSQQIITELNRTKGKVFEQAFMEGWAQLLYKYVQAYSQKRIDKYLWR